MLTVKLSHEANPDLRLGYWDDGKPAAKHKVLQVASLKEASKACRRYIDRNGLGGGNWTGGQVAEDGVFVARVSYNGRVWDANQQEILV